MHRRLKSPVSPATVLALIALFAALGGTGYAASAVTSAVINGKTIKNKSIAGKKLKNKTVTAAKVKGNTLTGKQINEAKLKTVPSAGFASKAGSADVAANTAGHLRTSQRVSATPGANATAAISSAPEVELFKAGTLTVYGKCAQDTGANATYAFVFVKTSQNGATLNSMVLPYSGTPSYLDTGTPELSRYFSVATAGANTAMASPPILNQFAASGPDGVSLAGQVHAAAKNGTLPTGPGPYGDGNVCLFDGVAEQL